MKIEILRLAIDFGLVVLIWMVQLLIYPGFKHFGSDGLARWHKIYAGNMTLIAAPMMLAQLGLVFYFYIYFPYMLAPNIIYAVLVALAWLTTFLFFIPMHAAIDKNPKDMALLKKITRYNWMRVMIWTAILMLDLFLLY